MKFKLAAFAMSSILFIATGNVMLPTHLACMMPVGLSAQSPIPSPPDGNPGHEEPGPGVNCVHNPADPAHNCACHRTCRQNTDDEGNPAQGQTVVEDQKCRSYCFASHCSCPLDENCA